MTSLMVHAALGLLTVVLFFVFNRSLFAADGPGARVSGLEACYYLLAVGSVCTGWYFNVRYVETYPAEASWVHFTRMLFTNPAAASGAQDLIVTNALLFPLWTMSDGPRRGLKGAWLYFVMSLVTSFGFAMGLYLAAQERQVRRLAARRI